MPEHRLGQLLREAEGASETVRAAALLRIARVRAVEDREDALRIFEQGVEAARSVMSGYGQVLMSLARWVAAAIAPERLDGLAVMGAAMFHAGPDALVGIMLDHGRVAEAVAYVLGSREERMFPFQAVSELMQRCGSDGDRAALLRRDFEAWGKGESGPMREYFVTAFAEYWRALPEPEALEMARAVAGEARPAGPGRVAASYGPNGVTLSLPAAGNALFQVFHVLRRLDPELAGELAERHPDLAEAVRRYPDGMESVREERAAGQGRPVGRLTVMLATEAAFQRALESGQASGDFRPAFQEAMELLRRDLSPEDPNPAPKEFWMSTSALRSVAHVAGARLGAGWVERIPNAEVRLLAAVAMEAARAGLPELPVIRFEHHGRERASVAEQAPPEVGFAESHSDSFCGNGIRCPKCAWRPRKRDRWRCECGHSWNTFDTGGVCPGCMREWKDTQCLKCKQWSPHSEWYGEA